VSVLPFLPPLTEQTLSTYYRCANPPPVFQCAHTLCSCVCHCIVPYEVRPGHVCTQAQAA